jgi:hypothetical protein
MLVPEELEAVLRMQEQAIRNRNRDPASVYNQTIRRLVYGKTFQSAPLRVADVRKMVPMNACEHFNAAFADPSQFTVVLVGAFDEKRVLKMCEKYLGCITPPPKTNVSTSGAVIGDVWRRDDFENITPAPFTFPKGAVTREIRSYMVEPMSMASITFPVNIKNPDWDVDRKTSVVTVDGSVTLTREKLLCVFATSIIERRLLALLRFKFGEIYTCAASASFAFEDPLARGALFRGDVMINFSCDPAAGKRLARLALEDIKGLATLWAHGGGGCYRGGGGDARAGSARAGKRVLARLLRSCAQLASARFAGRRFRRVVLAFGKDAKGAHGRPHPGDDQGAPAEVSGRATQGSGRVKAAKAALAPSAAS